MVIALAALTAASFFVPSLIPQHKTVQTTGRIVCTSAGKQVPLDGIVVNLYEYDIFDPDDFIANTTTDRTGRFLLNGSHTEAGDLDFFLTFGIVCDPNGLLAKCDGNFRPSKEKLGLKVMNRNDTDGFCPKDCAIVGKEYIPRNYNVRAGEEYPPLFNLGHFDIGGRGNIVCENSLIASRTNRAISKEKRDQ